MRKIVSFSVYEVFCTGFIALLLYNSASVRPAPPPQVAVPRAGLRIVLTPPPQAQNDLAPVLSTADDRTEATESVFGDLADLQPVIGRQTPALPG